MNAIGSDTLQMLQAGVREAEQNFAALVVGNDAPHFSAGANLTLLLLEAQEENWDDIDPIIRQFQQSTMGLRYAKVPVIVAPACRDSAAGARSSPCRPRAGGGETYMGLSRSVSVSIPAGAGTRKSWPAPRSRWRRADRLPADNRTRLRVYRIRETSASGPDAQRLGYLRPVDAITMNRDARRLMPRRGNCIVSRRLSAAGASDDDSRGPRQRRRNAQARRASCVARRTYK